MSTRTQRWPDALAAGGLFLACFGLVHTWFWAHGELVDWPTYQSYGAATMYEDSVHNASSVSWSASVPAYSTLPSGQIVSIVSGRGYVW